MVEGALRGRPVTEPALEQHPRPRGRFRGFRRDERGTALVEFALIAPLLFLLLFGIIDFGRALNYPHLAVFMSAWRAGPPRRPAPPDDPPPADDVRGRLSSGGDLEPRARRLVEHMALALQGSLLVRHAPSAVADGFIGSRLDGAGGRAFGTLEPGVDFRSIVDRATPRLG